MVSWGHSNALSTSPRKNTAIGGEGTWPLKHLKHLPNTHTDTFHGHSGKTWTILACELLYLSAGTLPLPRHHLPSLLPHKG